MTNHRISRSDPTFSTTPPWLNKDADIDISLHESISKRNDNPELLRLISLDHINRYNTYTHIYSDGSKAENLVAAAYTIPTLNLKKQLRLCNSSSIYAAELTAIKEAFLWMSENEKQNLKNFAVFSDSLSVLMPIKNSFSESRPTLLQETMLTFNQIRISKVHLIWIPSHVNILGNERPDALAKLSLNMSDINSTNYLELPEVFSLIKSHVISEWQRNYDDNSKGQHYKCICPEVNTNIKFTDIDRRKEVQISRLRLGKVNLNERLLLMKKHGNGLCSLCKVRENIKHLLLDCNKENISNILRDTCVAYKMDFNIKNLLDVGCIQNTVFRLVSLITNGKIV